MTSTTKAWVPPHKRVNQKYILPITRSKNTKCVRFSTRREIHLIERSTPQDIVGTSGVDNWMEFATSRAEMAYNLDVSIEELCFEEEYEEEN